MYYILRTYICRKLVSIYASKGHCPDLATEDRILTHSFHLCQWSVFGGSTGPSFRTQPLTTEKTKTTTKNSNKNNTQHSNNKIKLGKPTTENSFCGLLKD